MAWQRVAHLPGPGRYALEVHGESYYDGNLHRIAGKRRGEEPVYKSALLVAETKNRHDPNAIRVEIDGMQVGYVPAELAAGLRQALRAREMAGAVACAAVIHGGRMEGKRRQHYGVWLDVPDDLLDEAARAPAPRVARKRGCGCWPFGVLPVALAGALLLLLL